MSLLASFQDIDIYTRDFQSLESRNWLNDSCVSFCMKRIEALVNCDNILFMDASVVSFLKLQCESESEFEDLEDGLETRSRDWIFLPINDLNSPISSGGSHWSMLLCDIKRPCLYHFDSSNGYNNHAVAEIIPKIASLLRIPFSGFKKMSCPQQVNGYDCGVYALLFAKSLLEVLTTKPEPSTPIAADIETLLESAVSNISPNDAIEYRKFAKSDVLELASSQGRR